MATTRAPESSVGRRILRSTLTVLAYIPLVGVSAWAAAALWIDGPDSTAGRIAAVASYALAASIAALALRPNRRALGGWLAATGLVLLWWLSLDARNDREWMADVARPARAEIHDDGSVTIHNVRNFDYATETDFVERWETRTYDLDEVLGVDLFLSYWGPRNIAHTIVSWRFADGRHLAVSIETRKEVGEAYSATLGFFRQFELYYVVADERDVVRLRTGLRGENVYLYPLRVDADLARRFLLDYLGTINTLAGEPRWYNALFHNCTTTIRIHARHLGAAGAWDWRILANGHGDELLYENGRIDTSLPFEELRERSEITAAARAADGDADFSAKIRANLPGSVR